MEEGGLKPLKCDYNTVYAAIDAGGAYALAGSLRNLKIRQANFDRLTPSQQVGKDRSSYPYEYCWRVCECIPVEEDGTNRIIGVANTFKYYFAGATTSRSDSSCLLWTAPKCQEGDNEVGGGVSGSAQVSIRNSSQQPFILDEDRWRHPGTELHTGDTAVVFPFVDVGTSLVDIIGSAETSCSFPSQIEWPVLEKTETVVPFLCSATRDGL